MVEPADNVTQHVAPTQVPADLAAEAVPIMTYTVVVAEATPVVAAENIARAVAEVVPTTSEAIRLVPQL